jgi:uncharacterized protein YaaR (DUF327 family)
MTQYDFPNVSNYDSDLRELLKYYEQLVGAYSELVSGYEELESSFNNLKAYVDDFVRNVDELVQEYVGEAMEPIYRKVDNIDASIAQLQAQDRRIIELIDQKDSDLYLRLFTLISENFGELLAITQDLQQQIDALEWELPDVFNPAAGYETSISQALMDMWDALRSGAFTAQTWDQFGATAAELDGLDQTALWWDTQSESFFDRSGYCRNPLNGQIETVCKILQDLSEFATGNLGLTATAYDAAELDASTYEALDLTAYTYDFEGSLYIQ